MKCTHTAVRRYVCTCNVVRYDGAGQSYSVRIWNAQVNVFVWYGSSSSSRISGRCMQAKHTAVLGTARVRRGNQKQQQHYIYFRVVRRPTPFFPPGNRPYLLNTRRLPDYTTRGSRRHHDHRLFIYLPPCCETLPLLCSLKAMSGTWVYVWYVDYSSSLWYVLD